MLPRRGVRRPQGRPSLRASCALSAGDGRPVCGFLPSPWLCAATPLQEVPGDCGGWAEAIGRWFSRRFPSELDWRSGYISIYLQLFKKNYYIVISMS